MKITMYELLGLVKDGKAPKKVRFDNVIWNKVYGEKNILYEDEYDNDLFIHFFRKNLDFTLNDEVEILEEEPRNIEVCGSLFTKSEYDKLAHSEEEKKIPEKIRHDACWIYDDETNQLEKITLKDDLILNKLDDIIDYLDYLKSKGE